jgi:hypothetical protein
VGLPVSANAPLIAATDVLACKVQTDGVAKYGWIQATRQPEGPDEAPGCGHTHIHSSHRLLRYAHRVSHSTPVVVPVHDVFLRDEAHHGAVLLQRILAPIHQHHARAHSIRHLPGECCTHKCPVTSLKATTIPTTANATPDLQVTNKCSPSFRQQDGCVSPTRPQLRR